MAQDQTGTENIEESSRQNGERARTPGLSKSKMGNPKSPAVLEQGRARERRTEIDSGTTLESWKMSNSGTIFHFRSGTVTICGFGPTDKPEYAGGVGGTILDTDRVCALCKTAAKQQGVELFHPVTGDAA
jgi:hypothetical protein